MSAKSRSIFILVVLCLSLTFSASAHIGSPNVFLDGQAGPYPVHVIIRPPGVVPGVAEISVRIRTNGVHRVAVLPVFWRLGSDGSPPPDEAVPVPGETNLYHASLWLMSSGAYSVNVLIEGEQGKGSVLVPVNSLATTRLEIQPYLGVILAALGVFLFLMAIRLAGAAFSEAVVPPGAEPSARQRWRGRVVMTVGATVLAVALFLGNRWWMAEDGGYRRNRMYQPRPAIVSLRAERGPETVLRMELPPPPNMLDGSPVTPDHGKMVHAFLIREPDLEVFAHLHPRPAGKNVFETPLPPLPVGTYRLYADVTRENGLSETLTAGVRIDSPPLVPLNNGITSVPRIASITNDPFCSSYIPIVGNTNLYLPSDPDDSWHVNSTNSMQPNDSTSLLPGGMKLVWMNPGPQRTARETTLQFQLVSAAGAPLPLERYLGMFGHAIVRRRDGSVFTHLHPAGTISMASQEVFERREKRTKGTTSGVESPSIPAVHAEGNALSVTFPYEFPERGPYRIWVQVKNSSRVLTGVFDLNIEGGELAKN